MPTTENESPETTTETSSRTSPAGHKFVITRTLNQLGITCGVHVFDAAGELAGQYGGFGSAFRAVDAGLCDPAVTVDTVPVSGLLLVRVDITAATVEPTGAARTDPVEDLRLAVTDAIRHDMAFEKPEYCDLVQEVDFVEVTTVPGPEALVEALDAAGASGDPGDLRRALTLALARWPELP
jgi:hypothetical protein